MNQNSCTSEEHDHIRAETEGHQRRDMLLCINEILTTLDTASPDGLPWKAARKHIQLIEGKHIRCAGGCFNQCRM